MSPDWQATKSTNVGREQGVVLDAVGGKLWLIILVRYE